MTIEQRLKEIELSNYTHCDHVYVDDLIQSLRKAIEQRDVIISSSDYYSANATENFNKELLEILEGK